MHTSHLALSTLTPIYLAYITVGVIYLLTRLSNFFKRKLVLRMSIITVENLKGKQIPYVSLSQNPTSHKFFKIRCITVIDL